MHNPNLIKTFVAGADIAARRIVKLNDAASVSQASGSVQSIIGVTELAVASGSPVDVVMGGLVEVQAGDSITAGAFITSDANGKAVLAGDGDVILGRSLAAASENEYVAVQLGIWRSSSYQESTEINCEADGAVAAKRIVKVGAGGIASQAGGSSSALVGVSIGSAADGAEFSVAVGGIATVTTGATVGVGSFITSDANGKAVPAVSAANYVGMALDNAAADADVKIAIHLGKMETVNT